MADNLSYFSDDEESEWLVNIDPSLKDKSNEEKQLDDSEISSFIEENRNSNTTKKMKTGLNVWTRQFRSSFAYFCHTFPANKYLRNSPVQT